MKILVTGASGFIGSHVVERLLCETDIQVAALIHSSRNEWRLAGMLDSAQPVYCDLADHQQAKQMLDVIKPDVIIHCAWGGVGSESRDAQEHYDENLLPTLHLCDYAGQLGCRKFVGLGSQAEYGPYDRAIRETDACFPVTTYGTTKLMARHGCEDICKRHGMQFAWTRVFSTYGPKDNPEWLIPYVIRSLLKGESPKLTRCEQRWDFIYVKHAADAIAEAALRDDMHGVFNIGSGAASCLREVVSHIHKLIGGPEPDFGAVEYRDNQVMHLQADVTKLASFCEERQHSPYPLPDTIAWMRAHEQH